MDELRELAVLTRKTENNDKNYYENLIKYYIIILGNIRVHLDIKIKEQIQLLQGGKIDISQNLSSIALLNPASELQQSHLNRQIKQFKEL